jgi:hypothetical protein
MRKNIDSGLGCHKTPDRVEITVQSDTPVLSSSILIFHPQPGYELERGQTSADILRRSHTCLVPKDQEVNEMLQVASWTFDK